MTGCDAARRVLTPYVDGELVGDERRAVDDHLASCWPCRTLFAEEARLGDSIRDAIPRHEPSTELRESVEAMLDARRARPRAALRSLAAAAAVAVLAFGTWGAQAYRARPRPVVTASPPPFVALAVDSHLRYASGRLPLEVRSDRPDEVSRFFAGRVPFHVTLPEYPVGPGEKKAYELEGGRLVSLDNDYVAYLAYRMEGRPISLLVASEDKVKPSGRDTVRSGRLSFHIDAIAGLKVITWSDNGLTYALASDVSVEGARTCLVCHGSPTERRRLENFSPGT